MADPLIIYHHNCMDGFTAAWAALWRHPSAEILAAQYGDEPPDVAGRDVLVVDFSYPRETLLRMRESAATLVVLDHHKTAEEDLRGLDFCTFDMNRSGAGLAWDELVGGKRPLLVDYVEDRDLWRFALPLSRDVNAVIGATERTLQEWSELHISLRDRFDAVVAMGRGVTMKVDAYVREMRNQARRIQIDGAVVPCVNAPYVNTSELVGTMAVGEPFAVGWFQRADGMFQYSLRSRGDVDVSAVAKLYGGGGHKNAAGFVLDVVDHLRLMGWTVEPPEEPEP